MRNRGKQVTKTEWYAAGGFANSRCYRKARTDGAWRYYILID